MAKARRARGMENPLLRRVENRQAWVHLAFCQNHSTHVSSLVLRCPRSVRLRLVQLVVDHITLLVSVLISACCIDKWDIVLQNVPTKGNRLLSPLEKRAFGTYALGCAVFDSQCYRATVEEIEQDQDEEGIEDFVAFSIKSLEGFAILDGGATKTVFGFMSVQPVRAPRLRRQMLALRSLAAKRRRRTRKSAYHMLSHAEFPQEISVNVVSNESTPFLIGLDVLRQYGLVIDYHCNRVFSHILKRYLPCAFLPTRHLALEMLPSNSEQGQHPVASQALSTRHWDQHSRAQEKGTLSFESSFFHHHEEKSEHEHGHISTSGRFAEIVESA